MGSAAWWTAAALPLRAAALGGLVALGALVYFGCLWVFGFRPRDFARSSA
jgi:putative peptidoglycan lipid II flippase